MHPLPPGLDPTVVAEIHARLDAVERGHGVRIAFAIESGSRAWGFPSPDSDYDCRFVYIRSKRDYLSLYPRRDVIETELTEVLDVNGWDLGKAVRLLVNGNAVIIEWLTSPIVYREREGFRARFLDLAREAADRSRIAHHYVHLARRQLRTTLDDPSDVPLKKLFYALRPAIALRWLRLHPDAAVAPMHFPRLCAEAELPAGLTTCIEEMLVRKAAARELGRGPAPAPIRDIINTEIQNAEAVFGRPSLPDVPLRERADAFFRSALADFGPA
jgi:hypothetical protein